MPILRAYRTHATLKPAPVAVPPPHRSPTADCRRRAPLALARRRRLDGFARRRDPYRLVAHALGRAHDRDRRAAVGQCEWPRFQGSAWRVWLLHAARRERGQPCSRAGRREHLAGGDGVCHRRRLRHAARVHVGWACRRGHAPQPQRRQMHLAQRARRPHRPHRTASPRGPAEPCRLTRLPLPAHSAP